ncbi:MAG: Calx-beta domain-containing protein, partial [Pyrinomonadaceae bacterium]
RRTAAKIQGQVDLRIDIGAALTTAPEPQEANSIMQFGAASYSGGEAGGTVPVTITRTGDFSAAATVNYVTSDNAGLNNCNVVNASASSRCDYQATMGTFTFNAGESSKQLSIPIVDDSYAEGGESFNITLTDPTGATVGNPAMTAITITDNDQSNSANPNDQPNDFVVQHYLDFLSRQPDPSGLSFWNNQITMCGSDAQCIDVKRINVSAAFFLSIEFQETGYLVYRMYKVAYGNLPGAPVPIRLNEFLPDTQNIGAGVVVIVPGWEQKLEENKTSFAQNFVARSRFTTAYPLTMAPAVFVDAMNQNAGGVLSPAERDNLMAKLTAGDMTRAQVLRAIADDPDLKNAEFNRAFVLMQYFGYLRRNPFDPPEGTLDFTGYNFWLDKLNRFGGNFIQAEMVKAFISSIEYRQRFGPP